MRLELKRYFPVIFVAIVIIILLFVWYFTFPPSVWEGTPNYLQMYLEFVFTRPIDAFLTVSTGVRGAVAWVFIPVYSLIIIHIILYFIEKRKKIQYTIVNKYCLIALGLFAISFQNASQFYGWYWNPELNAPGFVDTWTHITSPWLLGALTVPLALERYLGWDRKFMWFFIFSVLVIIALGWEIGETVDTYYLRPEPGYFNYPLDSLKDIILGAGIGTVLSCWIYERLVMDLGE
ncbi:MAG: hypothetical protein ACPLY9_05090 [Nitrososphaerales archaeon]